MDEYDEIAKGWKWQGDKWRYLGPDYPNWKLITIDEDNNFHVHEGRLRSEIRNEFHPSKMAKVLAIGWMEFYDRGMKEKGLK
jgi:hypothetical protein